MEYLLSGGTGIKVHRTFSGHCIFPETCHLECDRLTAESQTVHALYSFEWYIQGQMCIEPWYGFQRTQDMLWSKTTPGKNTYLA